MSTQGSAIAPLLDHIILAGPDLDEVIRWFQDLTGIQAVPGGAHPTGTANALVALTIGGRRGPQYLELIGPDPAVTGKPLPTKFGIADLEGPALVTYAVHPPDLDAAVAASREAGYDPGAISDLSRRTPDGELLEWRLTRGPDAQRLDVPFLIDWGHTPHPGLAEMPQIELVSFERIEPDPQELRDIAEALCPGEGLAPIVPGPTARFRLVLRREDGSIVEI